MKIGGKEIKLRPGAWILLPALILAWITPPSSPSKASTVITNGGFDGSSGWTVVQNGGSGMVFNGVLRFSYATGEVSQSFAVTEGETVEISFTVDNSNTNSVGQGAIADTWNASLTSGTTVESVGRSTAHNQETFTLSLTVPTGTTSATLSIAGIDNGFWAGVYGPVVDSVSANITPAAPVATGYPADQQWEAVTYGDGKFVAIASSGSGNRVMTSVNGTYWTSRTSASNSNWQGITYADGLFVAVGSNAVMTSPDGITWTSRTAPNGEWQAITNCGGLFVATATWGSNYVMTSTNGIDWTVRTPAFTWSHDAVACSASVPRFVSVSQFGRGWSSADGISNWSIQNPGAIVDIRTVAFGAGRFSWLEYSTNTGNRYGAYSTNGVNWTNTASAPANQWRYITYGGNRFIAIAEGGVNSRSAYSADGANWTLGSGVPDNSWQGVAYGANKYVAVANSGTNNRVMTSSNGQSWESLAVTVPYFNAARNLTATANANGSVDLDWDAPISSNSDIYAYGVTFYNLDEIGGTTSGGWGVWTDQGTAYSLAEYMFSGTTGFGPVRFGIKAGNKSCFSSEGVGACVYGPETTIDVMVVDPTPPTTTTTEVVVEPEIPTTTELIPELEITTTIPLPITETTSGTVDETTATVVVFPEIIPITIPETIPIIEEENVGPGDFTESTVQDSISEPETVPQDETPTQETPPELPLDTQDAADAAVADIFDGPMSDTVLANAVDDLITDAGTPEELTAVVNSLLDQELTDEQFSTVIDSVFDGPMSDDNFSAAVDAVFEDTSTLSDEQFDTAVQAVFDGPLSTEQFGDALDAVFDEPVTDEKFDAVISAVLDEPLSDEQFEELVGVLESDTVTEEQVEAAVDSMIENGVTEDQATELATSEKVLESISADVAAEIFNEIPVDGLSDEQGQEIVDAVQNAPTEIKEAFEEEINVFDGAFDTYVPTDSSISVGERRTVVAVTVVSSVIAVSAASAPSAPSGPSGGNSGPSGGNPSGGDTGGGSAPSEDKGNNKSRGRRRK